MTSTEHSTLRQGRSGGSGGYGGYGEGPAERPGRRRHRRRIAGAAAFLLAAGLVPTLTTATASAAPVGAGFNLNPSDLRFILQQIKISERHAREATPANPCAGLLGPGADQIPETGNGRELPWGLRTVDGTCNNLVAGREEWGAADTVFPRSAGVDFMTAESGSYGNPGTVTDSRPRRISNLVVDQSPSNPAARAAAGPDAVADPATRDLFIPNVAPDTGLSAPFNSMFTLFGQFFDHGLDLVAKGGNGSVFMPLPADDPLIVGPDGIAGNADDPANPPPPSERFMILSRAANQPGGAREHTNLTTSFVDQNQTYTSHPSHQVFLREYALNGAGDPVSTGNLVNEADGMATWATVKAQTASMLGIRLVDTDVLNVPMLATDPYGTFLPGPNGFPQIATATGLVEGNPANGGILVPANAVRTGHPFLADIAHHAAPTGDRNPADGPGPIVPLDPDTNAGTTDDNNFATYDDEMLDAHFMGGDGRVNENIGLTAVHHVFHSEHNRLVTYIRELLLAEDPAAVPEWQLADGAWNGERLFQAARFVTEMEYQHLVFEEFGRKVQPLINVFSGYDTSINPAIRAEFAHAVYRFGHSMLTDTVSRDAPGPGRQDVTLLNAFLNPPLYRNGGTAGQWTPDQAAGAVVMGMSRQVGNEIDEFVTGALRNSLLGLPLDLATINMARARDTGVPPLNVARRRFYAASNNSALKPYESWADFGFNLKHRESLANFVAAYGTHPSITGTSANRRAAAELLVTADATNPATPADAFEFINSQGTWANGANGATATGVDAIDLWSGGLAEKQVVFGGLLGSTFNFVFENQMEDLQDGDRFYYLSRTAGLNMLVQLEGNSFAELIQRNTSAAGLPADVFSRPEFILNVGALGNTGPITDDPDTEDYDESNTAVDPGRFLGRTPNGTGVRYSGPAHVTFNGTPGNDRIWASEGDDTIRGDDGNDWMQGGDGVDNLIGGLDDDILEDLAGDDTLKGGDGNDALSSGQGFGADLNQGGRGNDFIVGGNDITETFAGPGNDIVYAGDSTDTVFGDDGDDWIEGGNQADLLQGDNGAPFQDDPNVPGHDVINGGGAGDDYDAEGGDDIMVSGPGIERNEGMRGFDWVTHQGDPASADADMELTGLLPPSVDALRDRFDLTEGLSGWNQNDTLRGDNRVDDAVVVPGDEAINDGHQLTAAGVARVSGLAALLPGAATSFSGGNIILGGGGSDTIEGRGGDDLIDGDAQLIVKLRAPNLATADPADFALFDSMKELQTEVFGGRINPGQITIVRQVETPAATGAIDTAVFTDPQANYQVTQNADGTTTVAHVGGNGQDGTDRLRGIERMVFGAGGVATVPDSPVVGTASPGNTTATVSFTPAPDDGGSPVTSFSVQVRTGATVVRTVTGIAPTATSVTITGLTNGTAYNFRVIAINAVGASLPSAASNTVTPGTLTTPRAPTGVSATAGNTSATVQWTPGPDGGSAITEYRVQVRTGATVVRTVNGVAPAATSTVVTGLTNGTTYNFRVRAVNAVGLGVLSTPSNPVTPAGGTSTVPARPVIGTAAPGVAGGAITATGTWAAPTNTGGSPITGYRVFALRMNANGTVAATTRSALQPATARSLSMTLPVAGNYRFQVVALNTVGASPRSARSNLVAGR